MPLIESWPQDSRVSRSSAKPSLMMVQEDWSVPLQPACLSQIIINRAGAKSATGCGRLTQGLPTLSWPPASQPSPPKPVPFWVLQEKQLQKDSPEHFFGAGMDNYFPISFLVPECPTPLLGRDFSYCSPGRRHFKTLFWGQTNYFYQPPSETTPEWERPFMDVWSKEPQISSRAYGKIQVSLYPLVRFLTQPPSCLPPRALSPFTVA